MNPPGNVPQDIYQSPTVLPLPIYETQHIQRQWLDRDISSKAIWRTNNNRQFSHKNFFGFGHPYPCELMALWGRWRYENYMGWRGLREKWCQQMKEGKGWMGWPCAPTVQFSLTVALGQLPWYQRNIYLSTPTAENNMFGDDNSKRTTWMDSLSQTYYKMRFLTLFICNGIILYVSIKDVTLAIHTVFLSVCS